jgi:hypothetical protein
MLHDLNSVYPAALLNILLHEYDGGFWSRDSALRYDNAEGFALGTCATILDEAERRGHPEICSAGSQGWLLGCSTVADEYGRSSF